MSSDGYLTPEQVDHHGELKKNFCQASEMVAKLFLGHTQSYHNGAVGVVELVREWAESNQEVSKEGLLQFLDSIDPTPSAAYPSKEQCSFTSKKRSAASSSSSQHFAPHPETRSRTAGESPPTKRLASAANGMRDLSLR